MRSKACLIVRAPGSIVGVTLGNTASHLLGCLIGTFETEAAEPCLQRVEAIKQNKKSIVHKLLHLRRQDACTPSQCAALCWAVRRCLQPPALPSASGFREEHTTPSPCNNLARMLTPATTASSTMASEIHVCVQRTQQLQRAWTSNTGPS